MNSSITSTESQKGPHFTSLNNIYNSMIKVVSSNWIDALNHSKRSDLKLTFKDRLKRIPSSGVKLLTRHNQANPKSIGNVKRCRSPALLPQHPNKVPIADLPPTKPPSKIASFYPTMKDTNATGHNNNGTVINESSKQMNNDDIFTSMYGQKFTNKYN
ncbi:hypothetical protein RDWZM_004709 [Blomia tropicalis]|uniref:Uncharacterized protein n=1 Tax=Blomia tropicalis TaxID=40697 RepID=A0A9Q0M7F8_BLOTA|nr:hypothetical protein RDWZM_004709 [Blomia tropicalis]